MQASGPASPTSDWPDSTAVMVFGIAFFLAGSLCGIVPRMLNERRARALEAECEVKTDL